MHENDGKWINFEDIHNIACSVRYCHIVSITRETQPVTLNRKWIIITVAASKFVTYQDIDSSVGRL
jgi:hypothetical protein